MLQSLVLCLATTLLLGDPGTAYELVTLDGRVLEAESVQFAGETCIVTQGETVDRLQAMNVDYYETFRRNAESGAGNIIVFTTGAYFRFETVEISKGWVTMGLGDQGRVKVPEQVVDFEQSVREAATIRLPRAAPRVDVAKSASGSVGTARGGAAAASRSTGASRPNQRSARLRAPGSSSGPMARPGSSAARRAASLRATNEAASEEGMASEVYEDPYQDASSRNTPSEESPGESRTPSRDGMVDPEDVRRRAEERGDATGAVSVIISSNDSVDVAAVQFRLRYPSSCSPAGAETIGAFANSSLAQPNGAEGGRQLFAMAIVFSPNSTTSLPGEIARVDFTWTGTPPSPDEFNIVSASASDEVGNPQRGFHAQATLLN